MHIHVVSLFPDWVSGVTDYGVVGRAVERNLLELSCSNPRDFTQDPHRTVDDRPYGGGPGMVLKYEPLAAAIRTAQQGLPDGSPVIGLSPQGQIFDQDEARRLAALPGFMLVSGRYEGVDERLVEAEIDLELSLGDFVLSGGEIAAMAVVDSVTRLLPGVLGDAQSAAQDSFMHGLLDYPHYTRPEQIDDRRVPAVLMSGDHERIAHWRHKQALGRSYLRRPELFNKRQLDVAERQLIGEYLKERGLAPGKGLYLKR